MNARTYGSLVFLVGSSLLQVACFSGEAVVGDEADGSGGSHYGAPLPERKEGDPACAEEDQLFWDSMEALRQPNSLNGLTGTWRGVTNAGALTTTITLRADGTASLYYGDAPLVFAPPTNGDVGYLCEEENIPGGSCKPDALEGFEYTLRHVDAAGEMLSFQLQASEPWSAWCELQEPILASECTYSPAPPGEQIWAGGVCTVGGEQMDCSWLALTSGDQWCQCTSAQCFAGLRGYGASLVFSNEKNTLTGWFGDTEIQLERL
jgi:hypothetical protein